MSFIVSQLYHEVENNFEYDTKLVVAKLLYIAMILKQNDYTTMHVEHFPMNMAHI
jgi:hypothetical protein